MSAKKYMSASVSGCVKLCPGVWRCVCVCVYVCVCVCFCVCSGLYQPFTTTSWGPISLLTSAYSKSGCIFGKNEAFDLKLSQKLRISLVNLWYDLLSQCIRLKWSAAKCRGLLSVLGRFLGHNFYNLHRIFPFFCHKLHDPCAMHVQRKLRSSEYLKPIFWLVPSTGMVFQLIGSRLSIYIFVVNLLWTYTRE